MESLKSIFHTINEKTKQCTDFYDFAGPYQLFQKLKIQGKIELEEVDFYNGYKHAGSRIIPPTRRSSSAEYEPNTSEYQWRLDGQRENKVRLRTELGDVLNNFTSGHICLVGPAGIGKTTLMKSIARNALDGKFSGLKEIEVVHFMQCRHIKRDTPLTMGELLFAGTDMKREEIQKIVEFAIAHPNKILFVFDSLDTLPYTVDGVYKYIERDAKSYPEAILSSFLSGKLLRGCRIISSSREHSIRNYLGEIRPQKIIALLGFSKESVRQVTAGYVGDKEADKILQHLKDEMPDILALCTTPVTLVYTLIGIKAESDLKPTTTTAILVIVLQSIIRSPHAHQCENILEVMCKLQELSHNGNMNGIVYFTRTDFERVGLQPETATDLAIMVPGEITQKLLQGESILFFSHQTFQEMLGALWVAGKNVEFLKDFLKSMNTPRFAVIRRYLYGILLNREVHEALCQDLLPDDENYEAKVEILKENLRSQLQGGLTLSPLLELMISMNEAKNGINDVIRSSLPKIDMQGIPLSPTDVFCVGSVLSRCGQLQCLNLRHCSLDSASMRTLTSSLKGTNVQILRLHFGGNTNLGNDGVSAAGEIARVCSSEEFDMSDCDLTGKQLQILANEKIKKLLVLNLSWNRDLGIDGISAAGEMTTRSEVEDLQLRSCDLSDKQLRGLANSTKEAKKLLKLHLAGNGNLGKDGVYAAGEIVSNCNSEELDLGGCRLSSEQLQAIETSTRKAEKLQILNLTDKKEARSEDVRAVANILSNVKENLILDRWKISKRDEEYLQGRLNESGEKAPTVSLMRRELRAQRKPTSSDPPASRTDSPPDDNGVDEKIKDELSRPVSTAKLIGKEDEVGVIPIRGCKLDFPSKTFEKETLVSLTVRSRSDDIPDQYRGISPELQCNASNARLNKLVKIKVPIYVKNLNGSAIILRKDKRADEWMELECDSVEKDGFITFRVSQFSLLQVVTRAYQALKALIFGETTVVNFLYYKRSTAQLYGLTCVAEEEIKASSCSVLEKKGYISLIEIPDNVALRDDENVGYTLEIASPPRHHIEPQTIVEHSGNAVSKAKSLSQKFSLVPAPGEESDVRVLYTLMKPNLPPQPSSLRLNEVNGPKPVVEKYDFTTRVLKIEVPGSTETTYKKHLNNDKIYRISPERRKGNVLIINNDFKQTRMGSEVDFKNMTELWGALGFNVQNESNLSTQDILESCRQFADDARNVSAVVIIIMSHGGKTEDRQEYFVGANGQKVFVDDIIQIFSSTGSPHLGGIPKLFVFQACRGRKGDYDYDARDVQSDDYCPERADMLICFPTSSGYKALRDTNTGSWLINAIANVFMENAHDTHVLDMMTMVNDEVGGKITDTRRVQISNQENYLRKKFFLFPGWPQENIIVGEPMHNYNTGDVGQRQTSQMRAF